MAKARATFAVNPELLKIARGDPNGGVAQAIRQALVDVALEWKNRTLPKHFLPDAPQRYAGRYTPRSFLYTVRKSKPHTVDGVRYPGVTGPMRYTGRMERTLTGTPPTIGGKLGTRSISVTLRTAHARALNLWGGGGRKHNFQRELTAVSAAELNDMAGYFQERLAAHVLPALQAGAAQMRPVIIEAAA